MSSLKVRTSSTSYRLGFRAGALEIKCLGSNPGSSCTDCKLGQVTESLSAFWFPYLTKKDNSCTYLTESLSGFSFIQPFIIDSSHLFSEYHIPGPVLDARNTTVNEMEKVPPLSELILHGREKRITR